ncbi:MAG: sensor domain-containing diguanylate cyclase [Spirochaetaceae bacterium]|nr:sensor domain-containing diguanylate cyclase [Spirochaetaceae bacterium]
MDVVDFFADSKTGFFIVKNDSNLSIVDSNDSFLSMTGLDSVKDAKKRCLKNCVSPNDFEQIKQKLTTEKSFEIEAELKKMAGTCLYGVFTFKVENVGSKESSVTGLLNDISAIRRREMSLRSQNDGLRIGMQNMSALVWEYDFATKSMICDSPVVTSRWKDGIIPNVSETLLSFGFIHPDSLFPYLEMHEALDRGEPECNSEVRAKVDGANFKWINIKYTTIYDDETCEPSKAIGVAIDINDQKERQLQYLMDMQYHDAMVSDAIYLMEINLTKNIVLKPDRRLKNKMGEAHSMAYWNLVTAMTEQLVYEKDRSFFTNMLSKEYLLNLFRSQMTNFSFEYRSIVTQDEVQWCRVFVNFILEPMQGDVCMLLYARNINDEKIRELNIMDGAERDSLTKLYNRATMEHKIDFALAESSKTGLSCVMLLIDLDNFKVVNETYGHLYGDAVLCEVTSRIKAVFPDTDLIGRVGGDEFIVFLTDVPSFDFVQEKAESVCSSLRNPIQFDSRGFSLTCSVGIAISPQNGMVFKTLYERTEEALYTAKTDGKDCFRFGDRD